MQSQLTVNEYLIQNRSECPIFFFFFFFVCVCVGGGGGGGYNSIKRLEGVMIDKPKWNDNTILILWTRYNAVWYNTLWRAVWQLRTVVKLRVHKEAS